MESERIMKRSMRKKVVEMIRYIANYRSRKKMRKNIKGDCIKIVAVKDGIEYPIWNVSKHFHINGNDNKIIIRCDKINEVVRGLPKSFNVYINGNHNLIDVELPINEFHDVSVTMEGNDNAFTIKSTRSGFAGVVVACAGGGELHIGKEASIRRGDNLFLVEGSYKKRSHIIIGDEVRIAAKTWFRNTYGETMVDPETDMPISEPKDIVIGDHVWIMTGCMIFAGCRLSEGSALAACSFANKVFEEKNLLIGGTPARIIKHGIKWIEGTYPENMEKWVKRNGCNA